MTSLRLSGSHVVWTCHSYYIYILITKLSETRTPDFLRVSAARSMKLGTTSRIWLNRSRSALSDRSLGSTHKISPSIWNRKTTPRSNTGKETLGQICEEGQVSLTRIHPSTASSLRMSSVNCSRLRSKIASVTIPRRSGTVCTMLAICHKTSVTPASK